LIFAPIRPTNRLREERLQILTFAGRLNESKSLYHGPSGTYGLVAIHSANRIMSSSVNPLARTRSYMCLDSSRDTLPIDVWHRSNAEHQMLSRAQWALASVSEAAWLW